MQTVSLAPSGLFYPLLTSEIAGKRASTVLQKAQLLGHIPFSLPSALLGVVAVSHVYHEVDQSQPW